MRMEVIGHVSSAEQRELYERCFPHLAQLNARYAPHVDLSKGIRIQQEYLDLLRGSWLLDRSEDRPPYATVIEALGYVFGLLLQHRYGYSWSVVACEGVQTYAMAKTAPNGDTSITLPFHYVGKREKTQNVEVFKHFFDQIAPEPE